ncbi:hypothetical protein BJ508DRAFT_310070 [Ascobolus immersus RN42]|uniref:Uncharacterized protein n=1 Tax=Ascobolus immersus RN42 TaxID=1160509 RepID=A0A3N4HUL7_ASCIM|nr:hypothetical protein BJ508DRAFT_310070 [Ascobolus immersus RN42]
MAPRKPLSSKLTNRKHVAPPNFAPGKIRKQSTNASNSLPNTRQPNTNIRLVLGGQTKPGPPQSKPFTTHLEDLFAFFDTIRDGSISLDQYEYIFPLSYAEYIQLEEAIEEDYKVVPPAVKREFRPDTSTIEIQIMPYQNHEAPLAKISIHLTNIFLRYRLPPGVPTQCLGANVPLDRRIHRDDDDEPVEIYHNPDLQWVLKTIGLHIPNMVLELGLTQRLQKMETKMERFLTECGGNGTQTGRTLGAIGICLGWDYAKKVQTWETIVVARWVKKRPDGSLGMERRKATILDADGNDTGSTISVPLRLFLVNPAVELGTRPKHDRTDDTYEDLVGDDVFEINGSLLREWLKEMVEPTQITPTKAAANDAMWGLEFKDSPPPSPTPAPQQPQGPSPRRTRSSGCATIRSLPQVKGSLKLDTSDHVYNIADGLLSK